MLITLLGTRLGYPKWKRRKGFHTQAAKRDAYEEAGLKGLLSDVPLSVFTYGKRLRNGGSRPAAVEVYAMRVDKELKKWPEQKERRLKWMTVPRAMELVDQHGMKALLLRLEQIERSNSSIPEN